MINVKINMSTQFHRQRCYEEEVGMSVLHDAKEIWLLSSQTLHLFFLFFAVLKFETRDDT